MFCDIRINIRKAKKSDTESIIALMSQIVQVHHATRPDIFRPSYKNKDVSYDADADAPVFVAVNEEDCVVGCLWCLISHERNNSLKIDRDWLVIDDICVDEKYRGNGIGTRLVNFAQKVASEKGLGKIELNVYEDNPNALRFYKHLGFKTLKRVMELNIPTVNSPDKETDEERQARIYPIILSDYNSAWPQWFAEEKLILERLIGKDNIVRISHYGSTSVPGLIAKPTIDILLEINEKTDVDKLIAALSSPEYICLSGTGLTMPTPPPHLMFLKGYLSDGFAEKVFHIHVVYPRDSANHAAAHDELLFRDYLINHPEIAAEYAEWKRKLFKDYEHNRDGYTEAKGEFIRAVTEKARKETTKAKTLYISDLDGTLLNRNAELSEYTVNALNILIAKGIHFSVATARTAATTVSMLERVTINTPIILMNGVLIYDISKKRYVKKELLEKEKINQILSAMRKTELTGLMYALSDDKLITYYERLDNEAMKNFVDERVRKYNKQFSQLDNFADAGTGIIYFCFLDTNDNIHRLYKEMKDVGGLRIEMYQDIYSDDLWYMEVFNETASKYNAVQFLRQNYGFVKVIGFGDNLNDIPLFNACDERYAVANAKPEVKEKATAVIGANDDDGVAKWLEENAAD